jgi:hypothetical protein
MLNYGVITFKWTPFSASGKIWVIQHLHDGSIDADKGLCRLRESNCRTGLVASTAKGFKRSAPLWAAVP